MYSVQILILLDPWLFSSTQNLTCFLFPISITNELLAFCLTAALEVQSVEVFAASMCTFPSCSSLIPSVYCWMTNSGFWEDFLSALNNSDARQNEWMLPGNISVTRGHGWCIPSCLWKMRPLFDGEEKFPTSHRQKNFWAFKDPTIHKGIVLYAFSPSVLLNGPSIYCHKLIMCVCWYGQDMHSEVVELWLILQELVDVSRVQRFVWTIRPLPEILPEL